MVFVRNVWKSFTLNFQRTYRFRLRLTSFRRFSHRVLALFRLIIILLYPGLVYFLLIITNTRRFISEKGRHYDYYGFNLESVKTQG
jgi:hypothetical protein